MRKRVGLRVVLFTSLVVSVLLFWMGPSVHGQDMQTCVGCHEGVFQRLDKMEGGAAMLKHPKAPTQPLPCEACHGSLTAHADSDGEKFDGLIRYKKGTPIPANQRNESCLGCHQERRARLFWQGSSHEIRDLACADCHSLHGAGPDTTARFLLKEKNVVDTCNQCHKQQVASQMRFSHHPVREGKMACNSCHQVHGTPSEKLVKANSVNELCWTCHPKYRGPFHHEHPSVRDKCTNCHQPHGTNYPRLVKLPQIRLCRECHVDFHGLEFDGNQRRRLPHVLGRVCTDCHVNIHGSNHPAYVGEYFLR